MYSNISQILLLYKTWGYYNKFDSRKSLGVYYWCGKIPQCGYMEHGLKDIKFYVQKPKVPLAMCYNPSLVHDKPLGAPAFVKLVDYAIIKKTETMLLCESYGWKSLILFQLIWGKIKNVQTEMDVHKTVMWHEHHRNLNYWQHGCLFNNLVSLTTVLVLYDLTSEFSS